MNNKAAVRQHKRHHAFCTHGDNALLSLLCALLVFCYVVHIVCLTYTLLSPMWGLEVVYRRFKLAMKASKCGVIRTTAQRVISNGRMACVFMFMHNLELWNKATKARAKQERANTMHFSLIIAFVDVQSLRSALFASAHMPLLLASTKHSSFAPFFFRICLHD